MLQPIRFGHSFDSTFVFSDSIKRTSKKQNSDNAKKPKQSKAPAIPTGKPALIALFWQDTFCFPKPLNALNKSTYHTLRDTLQADGFYGGSGQNTQFELPKKPTHSYDQALFIGLGLEAHAKALHIAHNIRNALTQKLKRHDSIDELTVLLPTTHPQYKSDGLEQLIQGIVAGITESTYIPLVTTQTDFQFKPQTVTLVRTLLSQQQQHFTNDKHNYFARLLQRSKTISHATSAAKDLANTPYQINRNKPGLNAEAFAQKAEAFAETSEQLSISVERDLNTIRQQYPAIYAVNQGSQDTDPARIIKLTYTPPVSAETDAFKPIKRKHITLIGSSIMFDTGGIQTKGAHMDGMQMDMAGGANILSVMEALGRLKPHNIEITAYFAATANEASPSAYHHGDIIESRATHSNETRKSVFIQHTDAQGRLALLDMVAKAHEEGARNIITMGSLSHDAARIGGGDLILLYPDDEDHNPSPHFTLAERIRQTARNVGEAMSSLAIRTQDSNSISGAANGRPHIDIQNIGYSTERQLQTAGAFIAEGLPLFSEAAFAHIDITGAMTQHNDTYGAATGSGVQTLLSYLLKESKRQPSHTH